MSQTLTTFESENTGLVVLRLNNIFSMTLNMIIMVKK